MPLATGSDQVRPCQGCGRLTRNTKMTKARYPDTVTRVTATHCQSCHRDMVKEGVVDPRPGDVLREERKAALAEERQAAAHRVREALLVERAARARRRMVRPVGLGQTGVRI